MFFHSFINRATSLIHVKGRALIVYEAVNTTMILTLNRILYSGEVPNNEEELKALLCPWQWRIHSIREDTFLKKGIRMNLLLVWGSFSGKREREGQEAC